MGGSVAGSARDSMAQAEGGMSAAILASLGPVRYEPSCVVAPDDSSIVRHAAPLDDHAKQQLREQAIARMQRDHAAITARDAADVARRRAAMRVVS